MERVGLPEPASLLAVAADRGKILREVSGKRRSGSARRKTQARLGDIPCSTGRLKCGSKDGGSVTRRIGSLKAGDAEAATAALGALL